MKRTWWFPPDTLHRFFSHPKLDDEDEGAALAPARAHVGDNHETAFGRRAAQLLGVPRTNGKTSIGETKNLRHLLTLSTIFLFPLLKASPHGGEPTGTAPLPFQQRRDFLSDDVVHEQRQAFVGSAARPPPASQNNQDCRPPRPPPYPRVQVAALPQPQRQGYAAHIQTHTAHSPALHRQNYSESYTHLVDGRQHIVDHSPMTQLRGQEENHPSPPMRTGFVRSPISGNFHQPSANMGQHRTSSSYRGSQGMVYSFGSSPAPSRSSVDESPAPPVETPHTQRQEHQQHVEAQLSLKSPSIDGQIQIQAIQYLNNEQARRAEAAKRQHDMDMLEKKQRHEQTMAELHARASAYTALDNANRRDHDFLSRICGTETPLKYVL